MHYNNLFLSVLLIILPISLFSQTFPCEIYFNHGEVKKGYAPLPRYGKTTYLSFSSTKQGNNVEKISIDKVSSLKIEREKDAIYEYRPMYINEADVNGGFVKSKSKYWARVAYENTLKFYAVYKSDGFQGNAYFWEYYIGLPGEDIPYYYDVSKDGKLLTNIGNYHLIKENLSKVFATKCPKLISAIENSTFDAEIKKNGIITIDEYYIKNCR